MATREFLGAWRIVQQVAPLRPGDRLEVHDGDRWRPVRLLDLDAGLVEEVGGEGWVLALGEGSRVRGFREEG